MAKEVIRDNAAPSQEPDGQLSFDQVTETGEVAQHEQTEQTPFVRYEPDLHPEVAQAFGQARLEQAQDEVDRRLKNHPHNASQIRSEVGPPVQTPQDEDVLIGHAARRVLSDIPKGRKSKTRSGLGSRQLLSADDPPPHQVEENRRARGEL